MFIPSSINIRAVSGYCPSGCGGAFNAFIAIIALGSLVGASARLPNFLITLRAVEPRDKAVSISVALAFSSAFAILPGPIVFGVIFDSACTIWNRKCGQVLFRNPPHIVYYHPELV